MKTNIILKNQDFRNCYLMWLFIDRYTSIGYDVSTKEKKLEVTDSYKDQLLNLVMMTYVSNQAYNPNRDLSYDDEDFKEKVINDRKEERLNTSHDCVYLDITHEPAQHIQERLRGDAFFLSHRQEAF